MRLGIHMRYSESGDTVDYLVARNNMLQDSTVALGAALVHELVDMPSILEKGSLAVTAVFALSAARYALHQRWLKEDLQRIGEW